jgi:hypothetical protein
VLVLLLEYVELYFLMGNANAYLALAVTLLVSIIENLRLAAFYVKANLY